MRGLSFTEYIFKNINKVTIGFNSKEGSFLRREGPNGETIDAFLFTLRFFYNKKDGCKFSTIEDIYNTKPFPQDLKKRLNSLTNGLKSFMSSRAWWTFEGIFYTNTQVFDTFMWGELAHETDDALVKRYD